MKLRKFLIALEVKISSELKKSRILHHMNEILIFKNPIHFRISKRI